jgi:hypothetical protein
VTAETGAVRIHIEFSALLDLKGVTHGAKLELPDGTTPADLLTRFKVRTEHHQYVLPFVNGRRTKLSTRLRDKDRLFLSLPVGGG